MWKCPLHSPGWMRQGAHGVPSRPGRGPQSRGGIPPRSSSQEGAVPGLWPRLLWGHMAGWGPGQPLHAPHLPGGLGEAGPSTSESSMPLGTSSCRGALGRWLVPPSGRQGAACVPSPGPCCQGVCEPPAGPAGAAGAFFILALSMWKRLGEVVSRAVAVSWGGRRTPR